jgi:DNA-directed RNA polymerase specialized sigma24 family protein
MRSQSRSQNSGNSRNSPKANYSAWYRKEEAAKTIGCSLKTVEHLARRREIQKAMYRRPDGGNRVAVYHPRDVEKIARKRNQEPAPHVLPAEEPPTGALEPMPSEIYAAARDAPPPPLLVGLLATFLHALYRLSQSSANSENSVLPPSELRHVTYLSISEARAYSGLPAGTIRRLARQGLIGKMGTRYRRADLEKQ